MMTMIEVTTTLLAIVSGMGRRADVNQELNALYNNKNGWEGWEGSGQGGRANMNQELKILFNLKRGGVVGAGGEMGGCEDIVQF